jgi:hypothetical protein
MNTTQIVIVVAVVAAIVAALLASQRGGPRVTTIEHRVGPDKPGEGE